MTEEHLLLKKGGEKFGGIIALACICGEAEQPKHYYDTLGEEVLLLSEHPKKGKNGEYYYEILSCCY